MRLKDGVVFCKVKSWFGRPRMVSLPFPDHTAPLVSGPDDLYKMLANIAQGTARGEWSNVELRPPRSLNGVAESAEYGDGRTFMLHMLDLEPSLERLFHRLNKDSTQRKILKARRQGMRYHEGRCEKHLHEFF